MSEIINDSLSVILDNIHILGTQNRLYTYRKLSEFSSIPFGTISSWHRGTYPKLSTLDKFCDSFSIHTSELFIPKNKFENKYHGSNNSMNCFRINLDRICREKSFAKTKDRINLFYNSNFIEGKDTSSWEERYYSYTRSQRNHCIPIKELDRYADLLHVYSYEILLPVKEEIK